MVSQRKDKSSYSIIGGMAGSSMDGLDLAHVIFEQESKEWTYRLGKCETITYPTEVFERLKESPKQAKNSQIKLDKDFAHWIAGVINDFKEGLHVDSLGVHGHSVIHKPEEKISWQLGNGAVIASMTGVPTVTEFRTEDVQNGGQGAPLVPFGDFTLFKEYDACLNLGGIANVSIRTNQTAWDICPCNQVLNFFAEKLGYPYDEDGSLAKSGNLDKAFYAAVSGLPYFNIAPPKSLPNNFIDADLLDRVSAQDGLHTYCLVIVDQIEKSLRDTNPANILVTGGGAFNTFLISQLKEKLSGWDVVVPDQKHVAFKESIIFAFLALKRLRNEINVLASVTGAIKDSSSGVIHLP